MLLILLHVYAIQFKRIISEQKSEQFKRYQKRLHCFSIYQNKSIEEKKFCVFYSSKCLRNLRISKGLLIIIHRILIWRRHLK